MLPPILESCHATWLFDAENMQFRRIVKGVELEGHWVATHWHLLFGIELDEKSEGFTVFLNQEHTKMIRSWRHVQDCKQCGGHVTAELSLEDLQAALT